jgi:hypothetical protein
LGRAIRGYLWDDFRKGGGELINYFMRNVFMGRTGLTGCVVWLFIATTGVAAAADAFAEVRSINPSLTAEKLTPAGWTVMESALGPRRQQELKRIAAATLIQTGPTYYAEEKETGRWLVGNAVSGKTRTVRCEQSFASLKALMEASAFAPLPRPPAGFTLRELVRLPNHPSRLASDAKGKILYVLCVNGDVWRLDLRSGGIKQILHANKYLAVDSGEQIQTGMVLDKQNRLYLVVNQRDSSTNPVMNNITIFRTTAQQEGDPAVAQGFVSVGHRAVQPRGGPYCFWAGWISLRQQRLADRRQRGRR